MPPGLVLGPLLFVIYINNVVNIVCKSVGATKIGDLVDSDEEWRTGPRSVGRWQMEFNSDKCEVMYFGVSNQDKTLRGASVATFQLRGKFLSGMSCQRKFIGHVIGAELGHSAYRLLHHSITANLSFRLNPIET